MKPKNITNKIKYDFSNPESQRLFEEFTVLLAEITKYVESQDEEIISRRKRLMPIQNEQKELLKRLEMVTSGRYMVKAIFKKVINRLSKILSYIPKKLFNKFKHLSK